MTYLCVETRPYDSNFFLIVSVERLNGHGLILPRKKKHVERDNELNGNEKKKTSLTSSTALKWQEKLIFFFSFSIGFLLFYKDTDTSYKVFFASQLSEANIMHICVHKCQMLMNIIEKYSKKANWNAIQNRPHMAHMRHINTFTA